MSQNQRTMRTPLGRVRHHGAAREGTEHFIALRVTSIALAILAPWFVVSAGLALRDGEYASVIDLLTEPVNAIGVVFLVAVSLHHMKLGMDEIIVDYIHKPGSRITLMLLNAFAAWVLGAAAIFSVLVLNFGA